MYFDGDDLIGYIGICSFGGNLAPFEINGMVHPTYRRLGVFDKLFEMVIAECKTRNAKSILLLNDPKSISGQKFIKKVKAVHSFSEVEMYLNQEEEKKSVKEDLLHEITFIKATNEDAFEVARQNAIYFKDIHTVDDQNAKEEDIVLPEEEEKHGMIIYLVKKDEKVVGKVHLQLIQGLGGIYGFGVLPENRRKGLGRAILLKAIKKLEEENARQIMLQVVSNNKKALNLYKSCGFYETSIMDYYKWE